jgi:hypothetical protein
MLTLDPTSALTLPGFKLALGRSKVEASIDADVDNVNAFFEHGRGEGSGGESEGGKDGKLSKECRSSCRLRKGRKSVWLKRCGVEKVCGVDEE